MPRPLLILAALLALALPFAGGRASAAAPTYRATPCTGDFNGLPWRVECGMLTVDETRGAHNGRRVSLPVTVVKALHPKPGLPPVFSLHGGPGGGEVEGVARRLRGSMGADLIAQDQDWVFFDQRGGVLSAPVLDCGTAALNDAGPISDATAAALEACGDRWAASGTDLTRYNAKEVALDVQDLRHALGLKSFDIFGVSYGTRIGFAVLTHAPQGVRAAVLDSVWPPEAKWAEGGPQMISDAVKTLFKACAADAKCHAAYPDPTSKLNALALRLLEQGPIVTPKRTYTADDLGGYLMDEVYDNAGAKSLPHDVYALSKGDYSSWDAQIADRSPYVEGQHLTHLCKEEFPFESRDRVAEGVDDPVGRLSVKSFQRYFDVCRSWPVGPADPVEQQPVVSNTPTLFLAAQFDPGCPPALAEAAAKRFSRGQFALVPNETHGVTSRSVCARRMVRAFLQDPLKPVDRSCLHPEHDRFAFTTP